MSFTLPVYQPPDFAALGLGDAPDVKLLPAERDGVVPEQYPATTMFPEYFRLNGRWVLAEESRMDSSVVICDDGHLEVVDDLLATIRRLMK